MALIAGSHVVKRYGIISLTTHQQVPFPGETAKLPPVLKGTSRCCKYPQPSLACAKKDIDTPALVIDLDAFESNLDTMAALLAPTGVKLRAHAKTHKSPVIARLQMARGAVGNCVQKVAEAEVLAWGGIPDILVSNEVVGAAKLARLCALSRHRAHRGLC